MKIAVCIKQVPLVSMIKFDNETRRLIREGVPSEVNHFDVLAVGAAVNLREQLGGEVAVYTMGPPQAREALVQCLAMGADRAVHLTDRLFAGSDTLATARLAGIGAAKRCADLVPLCHPIPLDSVAVSFDVKEDGVWAKASVRAHWRTGVEMEAFTAVSAALLTLYDMVKAVDRSAEIRTIRLLEKHGGASGSFVRG